MYEQFKDAFPYFYQQLLAGKGNIEEVKPGLTESDILAMETNLGVPLPSSYKRLLRCSGGFWLSGGVVQINSHPFFHEFPAKPFGRAKTWPPPSQGMLCFGEAWLEADGDQVLFDVSQGLIGGEYPVMYYPHEDVFQLHKLADSFGQWLNEVLDSPELN